MLVLRQVSRENCNVTCDGQWCSYCANKKLCDDQACQVCHAKSFATHPAPHTGITRRMANPRPGRNSCIRTNGDGSRVICHTIGIQRLYWQKVARGVPCANTKLKKPCSNVSNARSVMSTSGREGTYRKTTYVGRVPVQIRYRRRTPVRCEVDGGHHFRDFGHWNSDARETAISSNTRLDRGCHVVRMTRNGSRFRSRAVKPIGKRDSSRPSAHRSVLSCVRTAINRERGGDNRFRRFGVRVKRVKFAFVRNRGIFKRYAQRRSRTER